MKNNRLHITFNESLKSKINDGYKESYHVKKLIRAKEIVGKMDSSIVNKAIFQDANGLQTDITPHP